jgi:glutaredoxin-like protein NrdH
MYESEVGSRTPILFAISTCPRCQRMKAFLSRQGIEALVVDVDLLPREEKRRQLDFLAPINPRLSFPTLVIGDLAVIGEDYEAAAEALER